MSERIDSHSAVHEAQEKHHHHSHAKQSQHAGGHHLLQVEDLRISFVMYDAEASFFKARKKVIPVINGLSLSVHVGEILAVVGASGAGKTLLADALMGIFATNAIVEGRIWFDGELQDAHSLERLRGRGISLVPQSVNYLDPLMKVGRQVRGFGKDKALRKQTQEELFAHYDLGREVEGEYPFELSGGMARRVLLSSALIDEPKLIIADEPTPGLDIERAVRAMADFREFADKGRGVLLITHDIELALRVADRVAVFKEGTVVEETAVANFASSESLEHPFSKALWHALPEHDFESAPDVQQEEGV